MLLTRQPRPAYTPLVDQGVVERCVTCDRELATPFCASCGERRASDRKYSLGEFGAEAMEAFLSFDGRVIRTFAALLRRPGELTAAYMRGVRLPYLAPLQCFLLFNLAYAVQHVVFSLHVFAFLLCLAPLAHYSIDYALVWTLARLGATGGALGFDLETSVALGLVFAVYIGAALRRAYRFGRLRAIITAPLLTLGLYVCLTFYRGILFYVTMASV
jgi:hypothetical protein